MTNTKLEKGLAYLIILVFILTAVVAISFILPFLTSFKLFICMLLLWASCEYLIQFPIAIYKAIKYFLSIKENIDSENSITYTEK